MTNAVEPLELRRLFAIYALDPTFGGAGHIGVEQSSATTPSGVSFVHTLPDGKTLAGGLSLAGKARVHRFNITGEPDTTFSGDGVSDEVPMVFVGGGALQSDGKILLVGAFNDTVTVVRFTADGQLDCTFDGDGVATIVDFTDDDIHPSGDSIAIDSLGRIIVLADDAINEVGANFDPHIAAIARLNPNGSLDTTFAGDGTTTLDLRPRSGAPGADHTFARDIAVTTGDKIIVLTQIGDQGAITRLTAAGDIDDTFAVGGGDGVHIFGFTNGAADEFGTVNALFVQGDGKIVVAGAAVADLPDSQNAAMIRFNADGNQDVTFGDAGVARGGDNEDVLWDVDRDSAGRYLGLADGVMIRFTATGADDLTFGNAGRASLPDLETFAFELDSDDKALIAAHGSLIRAAERPGVELGVNGTLVITNDTGNNTITIAPSGANVLVTRNGVQTSFAASAIDRVDLLTGNGDDTVSITFDSFYLIAAGDGTNTIMLANGPVNYTGGIGNDSITVGDGSARIDTGIVADRVQVGDGIHEITTGMLGVGGGDDTIVTGAGRDTITTGDGNDSITTAGGAGDSIMASFGNDTITTASGNDTIEGSLGDDSIFSGAGDDFVFGLNPRSGQNDGDNFIDGGDGRDYLTGGGGRDTIRGGAQADTIRGFSGADLLSGNGGKDKIAGQGGRDHIYGGAGDDLLDGGTWQDHVAGGGGNDRIAGGADADLLDGDDGDDRFFANDGAADHLNGGAGSNIAVLFDQEDELVNVTPEMSPPSRRP